MANTKIPSELSHTPGISDNSSSTALTIDSSGKVGISADNPQQLLHLSAASPNILLEGTSYPALKFSGTDYTTDAEIYYGIGASDLNINNYNSGPTNFKTNNIIRLAINADGKVAIGGSGAFSGTPENTLSLVHDGHGLGFDHVSSLPRTAGLYTSSTALTQTAYGDLNIKARSDYGGYYGIGLFTAASDNTPVKRLTINSTGSVTHWDGGQFTRRRTHFNQGLGTYTPSDMTADTNQEAPWVGFNDLGIVSLRGFAPYIDIKTNYTADNLMFMLKFEGYLYNRGNSVFYGGGYTYNGGVIAKDIGATQAVLGPAYVYELYRASSDSALCIKIHANVANATYDEGKIAVSLFTFGELSTFRIVSVRITDSTANYY